jgi:hypothetical protein
LIVLAFLAIYFPLNYKNIFFKKGTTQTVNSFKLYATTIFKK